jgi:hypothetical protein
MDAFMRGMLKGNAAARDGNEREIKTIMAKYMRIGVNDKTLVDAYNFHSKEANAKYPGIPREGLAFIIDELAFGDKSWLEWKPEQFYDATVIEKLRREDFLDHVYREIRRIKSMSNKDESDG